MLKLFANSTKATKPSRRLRFNRWTVSAGLAFLLTPLAIWALNPSYAPGGNFDMEYWELQLPTGSPGSPTTIPSSQLQGSNGYQDSGHHYFFTESGDGAMVMKVPAYSSGCVTTPHSTHCRTELREVDPSTGRTTSWDPEAATNRMKATLAVESAGGSTVIGQIHIDDSVSTKPVCELYYNDNGNISLGVSEDLSGNQGTPTYITNIPLGQQFSYEIEYYDNQLKVAINGVFRTYSTKNLNHPLSYFKAGNYAQGSGAADVHFYALTIQH